MKHLATLLASACIFATAVAPALAVEPATIQIDASKPGPRVNPHMYGIFFEELNHSGDGGLYAEMVRNRSFEDGNVPEGMKVVETEKGKVSAIEGCRDKLPYPFEKAPVPGWSLAPAGTSAAMALDAENLLNDAQHHALRVTVKEASAASPAGVANSGYWGMSVTQNDAYLLTLFVRSDASFAGTLRAVLEDAEGKPLSEPVALEKSGSDWKKLSARLTARSTSHNARLALYSDAPGSFWLDVVSLFPEKTFNKRPNGLRADIATLLKDLKPGFMRFPGGCITEGLTLEQGYQWKNTIGDIEKRPGVWNSMWGYRRTDGLGYHELLQLCDDIGAAPMFCFNVGVACTIHTTGFACPMDQMSRYVDDAVDAIAYANEPATGKWGALRAAAGHAEPFNLKYVNIGNELGGRAYDERYPLFYKAVKARFPDVTTIAYGRLAQNVKPVEMRDLHDYRDDKWFLENMNRFDKFDRSGPKISNMELAVRNGTNHTLHNALLEAAYMLGAERNADVVQLVSYAPLILNVNHRGWEPDLIHCNNHQAFGTPSYYTQKLFMHHRPDVVLPTRLETEDPKKFYALAGRDEKTGEIIVKAVNLSDADAPADIRLSGAPAFAGGTAETLTSASDRDKNTFEEPTKVASATKPLEAAGAAIHYVFPRHSFVVLRLKTQKE